MAEPVGDVIYTMKVLGSHIVTVFPDAPSN